MPKKKIEINRYKQFQVWINSGKEDETLPEDKSFGTCDVGISADVVEHIRDPNGLLAFLRSLNCQVQTV